MIRYKIGAENRSKNRYNVNRYCTRTPSLVTAEKNLSYSIRIGILLAKLVMFCEQEKIIRNNKMHGNKLLKKLLKEQNYCEIKTNNCKTIFLTCNE